MYRVGGYGIEPERELSLRSWSRHGLRGWESL